jgi:two-component system, NarL family, invasion response regulator UvrY
MKDVIKIAIVDDHVLFQSGLISLFKDYDNIEVVLVAENGKEMIGKLSSLRKNSFPDVFIIDFNMPVMNGAETVEWLNQKYPDSKIMMLTMTDKSEIVMKMIKLGVKSYVTKDKSPSDLMKAISLVNENKFYFPNEITGIIVASYQKSNEVKDESNSIQSLTERELEFLELSCTEMTYSEISNKMQVSPRTVDAFRDSLFKKLNVKSRVGLILFAIKLKLITGNE